MAFAIDIQYIWSICKKTGTAFCLAPSASDLPWFLCVSITSSTGTEISTQSLQGTSNAWTAEPHRASETLGSTMTWHQRPCAMQENWDIVGYNGL